MSAFKKQTWQQQRGEKRVLFENVTFQKQKYEEVYM